MITDPSPALRKGHFDFARSQESDEESGKPYHCVDYSHVFRKITGSGTAMTAKTRDYMKNAIECCHRAPTENVAFITTLVVLNDLRKFNELELVAYLTRKGTGFFTKDWFTWSITSCRIRDDDGVMYLIGE